VYALSSVAGCIYVGGRFDRVCVSDTQVFAPFLHPPPPPPRGGGGGGGERIFFFNGLFSCTWRVVCFGAVSSL